MASKAGSEWSVTSSGIETEIDEVREELDMEIDPASGESDGSQRLRLHILAQKAPRNIATTRNNFLCRFLLDF